MSTSLFTLAALGEVRWPGFSLPHFLLYISGTVAYIAYRIVVGRMRGKTSNTILCDGYRPITGNVWLDGGLFAGILLTMAGVIWMALWW